ncbi:hypothetical protein ACLJYM_18725 [Rhizobium giardinii]|uniref:hypothetical protein n=1 Tax=Rhizobium giardinii TaxID=56731 RepID=UPI0039E01290
MGVTLKTGADYSICMGDFDLSELPSAYISQYNSTTIVRYVGSVKVTIKAPGSPTAVTALPAAKFAASWRPMAANRSFR